MSNLMYYVSMTDGYITNDSAEGQHSFIIAMTDKKKYLESFINFFFKNSKSYQISCVTCNQLDPDLYTIVKFSKKHGIYLPIWMLKYIEKEYETMCTNLVSSLSTIYTISKNNRDIEGMAAVEAVKSHFFKKQMPDEESSENPVDSIKDMLFQDYVMMHWISLVPYDTAKMMTLNSILSSMEYSKDMDYMYKNRLDLYYT